MGFGNGDSGSCERSDGRNLTAEWEQDRMAEKISHRFVTTRSQMEDLFDEEKVLGLFSYSHLSYDLERDVSPDGEPSIISMTLKAIRMLQNDDKGFVLIVSFA
jgi:alkaline phosphatase